MKVYACPYTENLGDIRIMIMDDPDCGGREVYYRIPEYPYVFAFGLPHGTTMFDCIHIARGNAERYAEVLFHE